MCIALDLYFVSILCYFIFNGCFSIPVINNDGLSCELLLSIPIQPSLFMKLEVVVADTRHGNLFQCSIILWLEKIFGQLIKISF